MEKYSRDEFIKIIQNYTYEDMLKIIPLKIVSQRGVVYSFDDSVSGDYETRTGYCYYGKDRVRAYLNKRRGENATQQDILLRLFDNKFLPQYAHPNERTK